MAIDSKKAMYEYIKADQTALGGISKKDKVKAIFIPCIWKYEKKMRILEYYKNCRNDILGKIIFSIKYISFQRYSLKLGYTIPINIFGPGLCLCHTGTIVINANVKFGANARIYAGVNIGNFSREGDEHIINVPTFGNNVYIGPGAKIFGQVKIGNDAAIGANAVVTKDVPDHVSVAGVPAKIINQLGSEGMILKGINT